MKKRILAALICAATVMSLTGCGKEEAPANTGNSVSAGANTGTSTPTTSSNTSNAQTESGAPQTSGASEESKSEESTPEESSAPAQPAANEEDFYYNSIFDTDQMWQAEGVTGYKGSEEKVVIPAEIDGNEVAGVSGFKGNIDITSVTIPSSVTYLSDDAFAGCINLEEVIFLGGAPNFNVKNTFADTPWLEKTLAANTDPDFLIINNALVQANTENTSGDVVVPDGVTRICRYAFNGGENITSLTIPNSVTAIGDYAFIGCKNMTSIKLPANITVIEKGTFIGCGSLGSIDIPEGVTTIKGVIGPVTVNLPDSVISLIVTYGSMPFNAATFKGVTYNDYNDGKKLYDAVFLNRIDKEFDEDIVITDNVLVKVKPYVKEFELPDTVTGIANDAFEYDNWHDSEYYGGIIVTYKGKKYNYANLNKLKEAVNGN